MKVKYLLLCLGAAISFTISACDDGGCQCPDEPIDVDGKRGVVAEQQMVDGYQESTLQNVKNNHPEDYKPATAKKAAQNTRH